MLDGLLAQSQPSPRAAIEPAHQAQPVQQASTRRSRTFQHTGVFKYSDIDRAWFWTVRVSAWLALLVSAVGSVQAFAGRWPTSLLTILDAWPASALIGGLGIQLIVTLVEWRFAHHWTHSWQWWLAIVIDLLFTCWGYADIGIPWLLNRWQAAGITGDGANVAAWAVLVLFSLAIALYPEQTLVQPEP